MVSEEEVVRMKLLSLSDLFVPYIGGGESYLLNIESRLVKMGHEVHHLTSKIQNTPSFEIIQGINVHRCKIPFVINPAQGRYLFPFLAYKEALALAKVSDIVQATTFLAATFGWKVGKDVKKPTVLLAFEFFRNLWKCIGENVIQKYFYPKIEQFIASRPYTHFIAISKYTKSLLMKFGVPENKITVIYGAVDEVFNPNVSGVSLRKKFGLENKKVFGFTGRLGIRGIGQSKGIPYLLEATKIDVKEIPDAVLTLGGSGFHEIKSLIKKLKIQKNVVYTGARPFKQLPQFYRMCDVIAGASLSEGFGLTYAEASACGRPVAATTAGSIPEVILNGKTGILVESKNPKALAESIIKLLLDEKLSKRMGKAGAKYIREKFNWDKSAKQFESIYEMLRSS